MSRTSESRWLPIAGLTLALLTLVAFGLQFGQVQLDIERLTDALLAPSDDPVAAQIIWDIRTPRLVTAIIAGSAMGVAGVLMQTLFRNPMADAWSLGLLAGGQLGVALLVAGAAFAGPAILGFLTAFKGFTLTFGAVVGVSVFAAIMISLSRRVGTITLLVVGLMLGFTVQGLVSIVMHFANRVGGRVYSGWNDGTFAATTSDDLIYLSIPVLLGLVAAISCSKALNSLGLGETYARSLGTDVRILRWFTLGTVVLLVAPVTAYCGPVTFIGLIIPHLARALARTSLVLPLIPLAALSGAVLALGADAVVHLPWQQHFLHLNAVLALIGAPIVIALLVFSPSMRGSH